MMDRCPKCKDDKQYCMCLPEGLTCTDCARFNYCKKLGTIREEQQARCDWHPVRFVVNPRAYLAEKERADKLHQQNQSLFDALHKIAYPLAYFQKVADKAGGQLDGVKALQISNDAGWLKTVAAGALVAYVNGCDDACPTPDCGDCNDGGGEKG